MKKIFITTVAVFLLMLVFFVARPNAEQQPPLVGAEASISMDFKDASLKDVLKVFSMQAGMNFIASEAVQDRKITLYLDKVPAFQDNNNSRKRGCIAPLTVLQIFGNCPLLLIISNIPFSQPHKLRSIFQSAPLL